ncbi:MAG: hypothetical protein WCP21_16120 [Armatimonadota bacterium]
MVIYVFPVAVLIAVIAGERGRRTPVWSLEFGMFAWAMVMLSRSSVVIAPSLQASKYALLVLLQVLLLAAAWKTYGAIETGGLRRTRLDGPARDRSSAHRAAGFHGVDGPAGTGPVQDHSGRGLE